MKCDCWNLSFKIWLFGISIFKIKILQFQLQILNNSNTKPQMLRSCYKKLNISTQKFNFNHEFDFQFPILNVENLNSSLEPSPNTKLPQLLRSCYKIWILLPKKLNCNLKLGFNFQFWLEIQIYKCEFWTKPQSPWAWILPTHHKSWNHPQNGGKNKMLAINFHLMPWQRGALNAPLPVQLVCSWPWPSRNPTSYGRNE